MTSDSSSTDVLDAVAAELSRFSRDVVTEVHRLRDQLAIEQQRVTVLETEVAALRRSSRATDSLGVPTPPAVQPVVQPVVKPVVKPVVEPVVAAVDPAIVSNREADVAAPATIEFAPLTLQPPGNAVPTSAGLDNLASVLAKLSEPIAVVWPTD
jgi:hypothetical protein